MVMDQSFAGFPDFVNGVMVDEYGHTISPNSYQYPDLLNEYTFTTPSPDLHFLDSPFPQPDLGTTALFRPIYMGPGGEPDVPSAVAAASSLSPPSMGTSLGGVSSSDESEYSETVLKFMSHILMEENIEDKPCMFFDPLGLQVTEKSFYDALGKKYPPSPSKYLPPTCIKGNVESPDHDAFYSSSSGDTNGSTSTSTDPQLLGDIEEYNSSISQPNLQSNSGSICLENPSNGVTNKSGDGMELLGSNLLTDEQYQLQFRRGLEEGSKFLPGGNPLVLDFKSSMVSPVWKGQSHKVEKGEGESSPDVSRGKKNRGRVDTELGEEEGRSNKQSAIYVEDTPESELLDMFEQTLSAICNKNEPQENIARKALQPTHGAANGGKSSRAKKQSKKTETVDLNTLLILCAQAVSAGDNETANQLLKQVRQNSSPFGDGSQRLAHFFANGLEARLAGTGSGIQLFYSSLVSRKISAPEILSAYKLHLSVCPFKRISLIFTNLMIFKVAEKATTLHVIDFGIGYGLQIALLIQKLSQRPGGPPKLRITGIELPQPGLRPAERVEETGRRLAKYCKQYNVPFEYHGIASQNWETIRIEDLKIDRNEMVAVNCLNRFKNLLDETVEVETSPRNAVLNLIRRINPDIFVHSIVNGAYNSPFFVTRFREALFHFSALYDIFDVTLPRGTQLERLMFEREFYGREAMNVIACEELQRVERPETYKQWQVRTTRAGFRLLPLDQELVNGFRSRMKEWYHKDFVLDEDNHWLLQGWKGRIVSACSCWVPA
ncbi:hypothetical protein I3843_13G078700 [Carya illinoinensis]|nr:hypothetical protein I3843_13G078700 [Carya illinoinensis]